MIHTSSTTFPSSQRTRPTGSQRGFSLLELIVVISITSLLAGLLLPAFSSVRENANRVLCGSNQRQLGQSLTMYSSDRRNRLPRASALDLPEPDPGLLAMVRKGIGSLMNGSPMPIPEPLQDSTWDGLGELYRLQYCDTPEPYYCPSHEGDHTLLACGDLWDDKLVENSLFGNYHYAGHKDWRTGRRRSLLQGRHLILATDGLRSKSDYSHGVGYNTLRGDGSVTWKDDVIIRSKLSYMPPDDVDGMRDLDDLIYEIFSAE
ncbi:MAG: prepilin-type N-terminal cleavage/methylation domain-containing protein [Planctomycetota bacterium]|nr:prepilin-type N-terminal cleavage/methylation domain-containing protein [Planctomycetota bacterium]